MASLILAIALALQINTVPATLAPPPEVQAKVKPILDLCEKAQATQGERQNEALYQAEKLIGGLFEDKTKPSDEALVVLMDFYIGESTGGDLLHQITVRGKRMLPLLIKYRDVRVVFPEKEYPSSILLTPDVRRENFDDAIKSVRTGKILGED